MYLTLFYFICSFLSLSDVVLIADCTIHIPVNLVFSKSTSKVMVGGPGLHGNAVEEQQQ